MPFQEYGKNDGFSTPGDTGKGHNPALIVGIAIGAVALIGLALYFFAS